MNLISHVAIVVVPRWVRVLVVVILATLSLIYLGLSVLHERPALFAIVPADAG